MTFHDASWLLKDIRDSHIVYVDRGDREDGKRLAEEITRDMVYYLSRNGKAEGSLATDR